VARRGIGFRIIAAALLLGAAGPAAAELRLATIFSDHAVLQRDRAVPIWGWADPGAEVEVRFGRHKAVGRADSDGAWRVQIPPMPASFAPQRLTIRSGQESRAAEDVLVGDVWFVGGQSNMEWRLVHSEGGRRALTQAGIPGVRLMVAEPRCAAEPGRDVTAIWQKEGDEATWQPSGPRSANRVGAVGFHMAAALRRELGVPIGLIQAAVGGARIQAWSPPRLFEGGRYPEDAAWLREARTKHRADQEAALIRHRGWLSRAANAAAGPIPEPPSWPSSPGSWWNRPTCFHNGMLSGILPYIIRGAAWYQGESNVAEAELYHDRLSAFLAAMRVDWRDEKLPIALVQVAPYDNPTTRKLPLLWEAQLRASRMPHTTLVTISDTVADVTDLHPPQKEEVGLRLARWALAEVYGRKGLLPTGPIYRSHRIEGNRVRIFFDHAAGLATRLGNSPDSFEIAGADRRFVPATASIEGQDVLVESPAVPQPVAVRFGWHPTARPNLVNAARSPAASFRTDNWTLSQ
jgi:sialate O-acetylesterase